MIAPRPSRASEAEKRPLSPECTISIQSTRVFSPPLVSAGFRRTPSVSKGVTPRRVEEKGQSASAGRWAYPGGGDLGICRKAGWNSTGFLLPECLGGRGALGGTGQSRQLHQQQDKMTKKKSAAVLRHDRHSAEMSDELWKRQDMPAFARYVYLLDAMQRKDIRRDTSRGKKPHQPQGDCSGEVQGGS